MSIPRKTDVTCPDCGKKYQATIFDSINTGFSPDVAETIISGELFTTICPKCGSYIHLDYDMLYHDMKHMAMIWVVHKNNIDYAKKVSEIRSGGSLPYKTTRIVASMDELREKVACLEVGKDDRVVELCKFMISLQLMEQNPDFKLRKSFFTVSKGKNKVFFYDDKGEECYCFLDDHNYDMIKNMYADKLNLMDNSPFRIIDRNWATTFAKL